MLAGLEKRREGFIDVRGVVRSEHGNNCHRWCKSLNVLSPTTAHVPNFPATWADHPSFPVAGTFSSPTSDPSLPAATESPI